MPNEDTIIDPLLSSLHHVLRSSRRRQTIRILWRTTDDSLTVRAIAREIAAREQDVPLDHATGEPYRNVYNALVQTHLPTLSEANILIYDSQRQTVSSGQHLPLAILLVALDEPLIEILRESKFQL